MTDSPNGNIFREIIDHVRRIVNAERAHGVHALTFRLHAEGAFFYGEVEKLPDEKGERSVSTPATPEKLTHQRAMRLLERNRLTASARGVGRARAGANFETVETRLNRLTNAVRAMLFRNDQGRLENHAAVVEEALREVLPLTQALLVGPGSGAVEKKPAKSRKLRRRPSARRHGRARRRAPVSPGGPGGPYCRRA